MSCAHKLASECMAQGSRLRKTRRNEAQRIWATSKIGKRRLQFRGRSEGHANEVPVVVEPSGEPALEVVLSNLNLRRVAAVASRHHAHAAFFRRIALVVENTCLHCRKKPPMKLSRAQILSQNGEPNKLCNVILDFISERS